MSMEIAEVSYFDFENLPPDTDPGTMRRLREVASGVSITETW